MPPAHLLHTPGPFLAVAVQYGLDLQNYRSEEAIVASVRGCLAQVPRRGDMPTLVVFPEDIGLGLILTADFDAVSGCSTLREAGTKLVARHGLSVAPRALRSRAPIIRALLSLLSRQHVEEVYRRVFGSAARDYGVYLCAGSAALHYGTGSAEVRNVSYLFGPDGEMIGAQAKRHLMEIEAEGGLYLCAAEVDSLQVYRLPFATVGIAICLDAFQPAVIDRLVGLGADVILQPSFNPGPWTPEQEQEWETALWQTVQERPSIRAGINPMMVGCLYDVRGEGRSSIVAPRAATPDGSGYLVRAGSATEPAVLTALVA